MSSPNTNLIALQATLEKDGLLDFAKKILKKYPEGEIYLVGGAVRDALLNRADNKDYDFVVRNVKIKDLEEMLAKLGDVDLVGKSFGVFKFSPKKLELKEALDIALPRTEHSLNLTGGHRDFDVQSNYELPIEDDLSRRDFTINAMAWNLKDEALVDRFDGLKDLKNKIIRTVGEPELRFKEDYLRMLRAIRFSCQLDFKIEEKTKEAIKKLSKYITTLSPERIRDEFTKIVMSPRPYQGLKMMRELGCLKQIIPELEEGAGVGDRAKVYDIMEHNLHAMGFAAEYKFGLEVRLAALLHDIAKPRTKKIQNNIPTFYDHDHIGARVAEKILKRLNYSNEIIKKTVHLVRYHMFYYDMDIVTDSGIRRLLRRIGVENIDDFIGLRVADRLGMGRPKAKPYKLVFLERKFKEVQLDPITTGMLAIDGNRVMEMMKIKPSPLVGHYLKALLGEVMDDPKKNTVEYLTARLKELSKLSEEELKKLSPDIDEYDKQRKEALHKQ